LGRKNTKAPERSEKEHIAIRAIVEGGGKPLSEKTGKEGEVDSGERVHVGVWGTNGPKSRAR